jgi:hypothetical protein
MKSVALVVALSLAVGWLVAQQINGEKVATAAITTGDLSVYFRDNAQSPRVLSGVDNLMNLRDAPGFDAFDPDTPGAAAGLNFEHIIAGHSSPQNRFSPRHGPYTLYRLHDGNSVSLVRTPEDDPWAVSSVMKYKVTAPHYIDMEFRCRPHDAGLFGRRGYAIFFFANYMNDVADVPLQFRGVEQTGSAEKWITADAPKTRPDWDSGGTYRNAKAEDLQYDEDHNFKLNMWSYDFPRFTLPFYYGRAAHGMVYILMFDKAYETEDEIRFSLFKFKLLRKSDPKPRPAWDFQYVIHKVEANKDYGFRARAVWKKLASPDDCLAEYRKWVANLRK